MSNTPPTEIEQARHRLEVLHADTAELGPGFRIITLAERRAIRTVLDELHRLNLAVSIQRGIIERSKLAAKQRNRKAAEPRKPSPTTHSTTPKRRHRP